MTCLARRLRLFILIIRSEYCCGPTKHTGQKTRPTYRFKMHAMSLKFLVMRQARRGQWAPWRASAAVLIMRQPLPARFFGLAKWS
jgi:hypothetical protein